MDFIFEMIINVIGELVVGLVEGGIRSVFGEKMFTSETWELFGELGAVAVCIVSLGTIRWAYRDRKAIASGIVLVTGGVSLLALGGLHWWKLHA